VQHEASWARIRQLEAPKPEPVAIPDARFPPPNILQPLLGRQVVEGEPCHFECQVDLFHIIESAQV